MKKDNDYVPKMISEYKMNKKRKMKNEKMRSIRKKNSDFDRLKRQNEKLQEEKRILEEKILLKEEKIGELEKKIIALEDEINILKKPRYEQIYDLLKHDPKNCKLLTNVESFEFEQICHKIKDYYENLNKYG